MLRDFAVGSRPHLWCMSRLRSYLWLAFAISLEGCRNGDASGVRSGRAAARGACGSQRLATVALGDALAHVRAARTFADDKPQLAALARLEARLVQQIETEPDSLYRATAWGEAERAGLRDAADSERSRIDNRALTLLSRGASEEQIDRQERELHLLRYRDHMKSAVKSLDPRAPDRCAAPVWQELFALALDAQAR